MKYPKLVNGKVMLIVFALLVAISSVSALAPTEYNITIYGEGEIPNIYKKVDVLNTQIDFVFAEDVYDASFPTAELRQFVESILVTSSGLTTSQIPGQYNDLPLNYNNNCKKMGENAVSCLLFQTIKERPNEINVSIKNATNGFAKQQTAIIDDVSPTLQIENTDDPLIFNLIVDDSVSCSGIKFIRTDYLGTFNYKTKDCRVEIELDLRGNYSGNIASPKFSVYVEDFAGNDAGTVKYVSAVICDLCVLEQFVYDKKNDRKIEVQTGRMVANLCINASAASGISEVGYYYQNRLLKAEAGLAGEGTYCTADIGILESNEIKFKISSNDGNVIEETKSFNLKYVRDGPFVKEIEVGSYIQPDEYSNTFSLQRIIQNPPENDFFANDYAYYSNKIKTRVKARIEWQVSKLDTDSINLKTTPPVSISNKQCIEVYDYGDEGLYDCFFEIDVANHEDIKIEVVGKNIDSKQMNERSVSRTITLDNEAPELLSYEQTDRNKANPYISKYSTFDIDVVLRDDYSGLDVSSTYIDFANLTENGRSRRVAGDCDTSISPFKCAFAFQSQKGAGNYYATLYAYDTVNNYKSYTINITVFEYVNASDWFYFDVEKMIPQAYDRSKIKNTNPSIYLFGTIRPTSENGAEIIDVEISGKKTARCWANIPNTELYQFIDEPILKLIGEDEDGNRQFQLRVRAKATDKPTPDTITITCPIRMRGVAGTQIISEAHSEYDQLTFTVSYVNQRTALFSETVADKIIAAGDNQFITNKWIGKLSKLTTRLEKICKIGTIIQRVYDALTRARSGVYISLSLLQKLPGGQYADKLWIGYNQNIERLRCSLEQMNPVGPKARWGWMRQACELTTCNNGNNPGGTNGLNIGIFNELNEKIISVNQKIYDQAAPIEERVDDVLTSFEERAVGLETKMDTQGAGADKKTEGTQLPETEANQATTNNQATGDNQITGRAASVITKQLNVAQVDASNSLVAAVSSFCLGGIIKGLERKRVVECTYINCLWDVGKAGGNLAYCDEYKSYANCKYVMGEVTGLFPALKILDKIKKNALERLKELPAKYLQYQVFKKYLAKFQQCGSALNMNSYDVTGELKTINSCNGAVKIPALGNTAQNALLIKCGLYESLIQKRDIGEIFLPVKQIKDAFKLEIDNPEQICENVDERIQKAKDIKVYLNEKYVPPQRAPAANNSGADQQLKQDLFNEVSKPLIEARGGGENE